MNWGLRCGQLLAEEGDIRRMNIIERTALWYRLERIGNPYWPYKEEAIETPTPEIRGRRYVYLSLDKKALELQERIVSLEEEVKGLRATASKKSKDIYTISSILSPPPKEGGGGY